MVRQTMLRNSIQFIVTENTKYALRVANPQAADRPARGWLPKARIIMKTPNTPKVANPRAADRLAGGWPPKRHIIMTP
jgi:hypothetical protein